MFFTFSRIDWSPKWFYVVARKLKGLYLLPVLIAFFLTPGDSIKLSSSEQDALFQWHDVGGNYESFVPSDWWVKEIKKPSFGLIRNMVVGIGYMRENRLVFSPSSGTPSRVYPREPLIKCPMFTKGKIF